MFLVKRASLYQISYLLPKFGKLIFISIVIALEEDSIVDAVFNAILDIGETADVKCGFLL